LASSLPNWQHLDESAKNAVFSATVDAVIFLVKVREDHAGYPRLATVKANLALVHKMLTDALMALDALDIRTATIFKKAAGEKRFGLAECKAARNDTAIPGDSLSRGHYRTHLMKRALGEAVGWVKNASANLPRQDKRVRDDPGLDHFAQQMAHIWESYGGVRFTASRKKGGAPDFIETVLSAAGCKISRAKVVAAAQSTAVLRRDHPDRLVVSPEDRHLSLAELVGRRSTPKKGKPSASRKLLKTG
jgi:hypothetical protein